VLTRLRAEIDVTTIIFATYIVVMKKFLDILTYLAFTGYIAFIPTGPYSIPIFGVKLDILFGAMLLLLVLRKITHIGRNYPPTLLIAITLYTMTTFLSCVLSEDLSFSSTQWLNSFGYILVCFLAPLAVHSQIKLFRVLLLIFSVLVAGWLIKTGISQPAEAARRIYLGFDAVTNARFNAENTESIDPNMTAMGLMMSILIYIPNLREKNINKIVRVCEFASFAIITLGVTFTMSRTGIVSLLGSCLLSGLIVSIRTGKIDLMIQNFLKLFMIIGFFTFLGYGVSLLAPSISNAFINRLGEGNDADRIFIMMDGIHTFLESDKNIVIGKGFFLTNPHNELLRSLSSSGLLGLFSFISFLSALYMTVVRKIQVDYYLAFGSTALFFFIFLAIQTYGHTKSMWSAFMFLLVLYLENRRLQESDSALLGRTTTPHLAQANSVLQ
jgi:hypothetical protein